MTKLTSAQGKFLLTLARRSIEYYLKKGKVLEIKPAEVKGEELVLNGASFVTIYSSLTHELRGCIGTLEANRSLVFDVADNAVNAATRDPRFYPIAPEELKDVIIEVSVLSAPRKLTIKSADDLLSQLVPRKHGLTIVRGWARATFLPVVWEQLPEKEEFLSSLCMKAGLDKDAWKDVKTMEFFTYEAQEFEETIED